MCNAYRTRLQRGERQIVMIKSQNCREMLIKVEVET